MSQPRPKFEPQIVVDAPESLWLPLIRCPANFPAEIFEVAILQLVHHPEYNSTLILRSEVLVEHTSDFPSLTPTLEDAIPVRCIHRKLLPRRPGRDAALEQYCTFYSTKGSTIVDNLVLTPIPDANGALPYYHPAVHHIRFRYLPGEVDVLQIEVDRLPGTPTDPNSRLYRTSLALLDTVHRYGWGALGNYKKRVHHDCIITREAYQDLYLLMRERHKHLVDTWQEVTDPYKHVFEDIGIATFLMLLWKDSYPASQETIDETAPWKSWGRPLGGFIDFGCGNGLLTHILVQEGYTGVGIDVRARTSWSHYAAPTPSSLRVHAFDPLSLPSDDALFPAGAFIIGNHADELTPWVPVVATLTSASGYISIPCCAWSFDAKFERSSTKGYPHGEGFVESLSLGGDGSNASSYSMYRIWLASLSVHCGWKVESETLRIPSTRNWAIVGRKREGDAEEARANAQEIVDDVRNRGVFKSRKPEGKAGEH
ncbi:DUF1613 domain-containing protein [Ephemerocybe angulata]|uniref:tRNA (uracil-O(2)-)-methyltransferase n=1 Tax=Ephemerocybe angulata TaxID=980116 RepID=A0A8H6I060_9AGAR|nr:DUF1613 domain-containing protein [Tulosesus angulatus]